MKKVNLTGILLILSGITFWISWFLMPDPGTTDAAHILEIVKQSRSSVFASVIVQIISSVLYIAALFFLTQLFSQRKSTLVGIILFGVGVMGLCVDAFFHLLAYGMTGNEISIQENVVKVMHFMQTDGVVFLLPILLPFFIGSLVIAIGLNKQGVISKIPMWIFAAVFVIGPVGTNIAKTAFSYNGNIISLALLGMFAAGHAFIGSELIAPLEVSIPSEEKGVGARI